MLWEINRSSEHVRWRKKNRSRSRWRVVSYHSFSDRRIVYVCVIVTDQGAVTSVMKWTRQKTESERERGKRKKRKRRRWRRKRRRRKFLYRSVFSSNRWCFIQHYFDLSRRTKNQQRTATSKARIHESSPHFFCLFIFYHWRRRMNKNISLRHCDMRNQCFFSKKSFERINTYLWHRRHRISPVQQICWQIHYWSKIKKKKKEKSTIGSALFFVKTWVRMLKVKKKRSNSFLVSSMRKTHSHNCSIFSNVFID